jgi:hypothetical protein
MAIPLILSEQEASNMASPCRQTFDNVLVRPQIAAAWLNTINTRNRRLKPRAIEQYANDIKSGKWTPSRIVFYHDGILCDGQNRLAAVVKSGVPVAFDILVGAADIEGVNIDMGVKRKQGDSLKLQGAEQWIATNITIGIINYIVRMSDGNAMKLSHNQIKEYAEKNQEWIKPIIELTGKKRNLTTSAYFASIALALRAGEPLTEIMEFNQSYVTGEVFDKNKNAVIKIREYCLENKQCWTGYFSCDTGKLVQRALSAYINRQPLQKLYVPSDWIYSLPKINKL